MVQQFVQEHTFQHPWECVTAANWKKYVDLEHRPLLSHVVDVKLLNKSIKEQGGELHTSRAITINIPGPWWLQRVVGTNVCQTLEESVVHAGKRSLETITRNVTLTDFVDVEDKCSFLPHPENPEWTLLRQQTSITSTSVPSVAAKIEQQCAEKLQHNNQRGREVVESVCQALERAESSSTTAARTTTTKTLLAKNKAKPKLLVSPSVASPPIASCSNPQMRLDNSMVHRILERAKSVCGKSNFDSFFYSSMRDW